MREEATAMKIHRARTVYIAVGELIVAKGVAASGSLALVSVGSVLSKCVCHGKHGKCGTFRANKYSILLLLFLPAAKVKVCCAELSLYI